MTGNVIENWNEMAVNKRKKRTEPKFPCVDTVLSDGQWKGEPCVVLGGGPSLKKVMHRVQEFRDDVHIVGANQAWRFDPAPELVYIIDEQVFNLAENNRDYKEQWSSLSEKQIRVTHRANATKGDWQSTYWVNQLSHRSWGETLHNGIVSANNTGLAVLNLVDVLGASPIILLGFDANRGEGRDLNWHQDYPDTSGWKPVNPEKTFQKWTAMCGELGGKIKGTVLNANPDSSWPVFEKVTFDEALSRCSQCRV